MLRRGGELSVQSGLGLALPRLIVATELGPANEHRGKLATELGPVNERGPTALAFLAGGHI